MFETGTVFLIFLLYMGALFLIAQTVERNAALSQALARHPWVYALSITVYCTSWTFYGSVGLASTSGLAYLPTYLGPTLAISLWWVLLRKMVRIKEKRAITSIADFISARYDRSQGVAMLVTLIALLGTVPYIALQLKAVVTSFSIVTGAPADRLDWGGIGIWATLLLVAFTALFGARRLDPTERHQGMMAALAVECLIKLVAFLAVGSFVLFGLFDGVGDLFARLPEADLRQLTQIGNDDYASYVRWMTVLFISMAGILFLPRQFHTAVIENSAEGHIRTAIWLVPAYMLLISLFVVPLAAAGRVQGLPPELAEFFVLLLPINADQQLLAALVFLGGIAAASGMIIISSLTLATMATNHLLVPVINRVAPLHFVKRYLLQARWLAIAAVLLVSYLFARELTEGRLLANIGILGFCAALQFVPAIVGGLYWLRGNRVGALLGLGLGFVVWFYTLMVPMLAHGGLVPFSVVEQGLFGWGWLRPEALFGLDRFDSVTHSAFWSLLFNGSAYLLGSLLGRQRESELELASSYVHAFHFSGAEALQPGDESGSIDKEEKLGEAKALLEHYVTEKIARGKIRQITEGLGILEKELISAGELLRFHRELERVLAGSIGTAAAHRAMKQHLSYSQVEHEQVSHIYAGILANLRLSPDELLERISYFEERDKILRQHTTELEARVTERETEIRARKRAEREREQALHAQQLLNEILRLSLEPLSMRQILTRALRSIIEARWLPTEAKGGIFLADEEKRVLRLFVHEGLDESVQQLCSEVNYGRCICGRVAETQQLLHTDVVDERHENHYQGMAPHGHYAVPIHAGDQLLGVLILYLREGHDSDPQEAGFLEAVANTLGGLIQRNRTQQALSESRARLQAFMNNTSAVIYVKDLEGRYLMINRTFEELLALPQSEILGRQDWDLIGQEAGVRFFENDQVVAATGQSQEFEELLPLDDGMHTYLSVKFPLVDEYNNIVAVGGISTDITGRIRMEQELKDTREQLEKRVEERTAALSQTLVQMEKEIDSRILVQQALELEKEEQKKLIDKLEEAHNQLLQSEKMAAIGQLAAGVAHEINNPVGYINSNLGTLAQYVGDLQSLLKTYEALEPRLSADGEAQQRLADAKQSIDYTFLSDDIADLLRESQEGVERVCKIVKDLKDFSHVDKGEWLYADLHQCLDSTLNVVWNELKYKADVVKEYGRLPEVYCLASQLNQVFMNLLVNAAHAIQEHGTITVRTGCAEDAVWVEVEDTGCGMPEAVTKRIFEPFYTTKSVGKGTGLGLSLSYGIVEKHHGRIDIDSRVGEGTRFRVWLPLLAVEEEGKPPLPPGPQESLSEA